MLWAPLLQNVASEKQKQNQNDLLSSKPVALPSVQSPLSQLPSVRMLSLEHKRRRREQQIQVLGQDSEAPRGAKCKEVLTLMVSRASSGSPLTASLNPAP